MSGPWPLVIARLDRAISPNPVAPMGPEILGSSPRMTAGTGGAS